MKGRKIIFILFALLCWKTPLSVMAVESEQVVSQNKVWQDTRAQSIYGETGYQYEDSYWEFYSHGDEQLSHSKEAPLPEAYDSRTYGYVTDTKSQEGYGTCWAFATIAAAETSLIKSGLAEKSLDLSEYHLAYFAFSQNKDPLGNTDEDCYIPGDTLKENLNSGARAEIAVEQLAKWCGPIKEEVLPYENALNLLAPRSEMAFQSLYHMKNAYYADADDQDSVKRLVYQYGAATMAFYADVNYFKTYKDTNTYHLPKVNKANHAVCIIGWDDHFPKENFAYIPPGDGAWLCKDSNAVNDGYMWISYHTRISEVVAMEFEEAGKLTNNYQYDGCIGGTRSFSMLNLKEDLPVTSFMNLFEAKDSEQYLEKLEAVSIHVNGNETCYVTVYVNPIINEEGEITDCGYKSAPVLCQAGEYAGIRRVDMKEPIYLNQGDTFAVEVTGEEISNYAVSVSMDKGIEVMNSKESFAGLTVNGVTTYFDLAENEVPVTPRIKGFTKPTKIPCATGILLDTQQISLFPDEVYPLQASAVVPAGGLCGVSFHSSDPSIASVAANGEVTAHAPGHCVITAACTYGAAQKSCEVQVEHVQASSLSVENYVNLKEGENYTLTPILDVKATNRKLSYISENEKVAVVNECGEICGVKQGETRILVKTTDGSDLLAVCEVKVAAKYGVTEKIFLSSQEQAIPVGGSTKCYVTRYPSIVDDDRVEYIVSNPSILSVKNGEVYGLSKGSAEVAVKALDSGVWATITIQVFEIEPDTKTSQPVENPKTNQPVAQEPDSQIGKMFKSKNLNYKVTGKNAVTVLGAAKGNMKTIIIPKSVKYKGKNYLVTEVSGKAFYNQKKLATLKIGVNIRKIGKSAFYKCKSLKKVTIQSVKVTEVGKNAFGKTKDNMTMTVPKNKLVTYRKKVFKNAGLGKKITWKNK